MSQKLTFTTTNVLHATVSNATDVIYYDVQTPEWDPHQTTVRRLDPRTGMFEQTGVIRNDKDKPTVDVSLFGCAFEPAEQWIKKIDGAKPEDSRWQFDDGEGNVFAWGISNKELKLYGIEGVSTQSALATFHQHKRHMLLGCVSEPAYLEIDNSVLQSIDAILLSLLIVERKRRGKTLV